jgi:hypothetical protein
MYYIVAVGSAAFSWEGVYVKMFLIILEVGPTFVFIKGELFVVITNNVEVLWERPLHFSEDSSMAKLRTTIVVVADRNFVSNVDFDEIDVDCYRD